MPDKILITEITVNGRVLRAEPPVEVRINPYFGSDLVQACCDFGSWAGSDDNEAVSNLKEHIAEKMMNAEKLLNRYRQRFKESE